MAKNVDHIDELIASVLSSNAGAQECAALKDWIAASDEHRRHFEQMMDIWFASGTAQHLNKHDFETGLSRFSRKVQAAKQHPVHRPERKRTVKLRIPQMAAMLAVVFASGALSFRYFNKQQAPVVSYYEAIVPLGSKSQMVLTDGTRVWLNAGSRLRYSTSFAVNDRNVQLEGEGYFEVAKNSTLPFEVKTSKLNVKATGTAFNVKAYPNDTIVETILVEGKVEVTRVDGSNTGEKSIALTPRQRLTLVKRSGEILFETRPREGKTVPPVKTVTEEPVQNIKLAAVEPQIREVPAANDYMVTTTWKDKRWRIDSEELRSLATKLERRYNVNISFADGELQNYRFNGTLEDEPIEAVLKAMAQVAPVKFELNGSNVVLLKNQKFREQHKELYNR